MGTGTKTPSEPGAPTVAPAEATWPWALEGFQAGLGLPSSTHPNLPSFSSCSGQPRFRTEGQGEVWLLALRSCRAAVGCTVSHHLSGAQPTGSPHPLSGDSGTVHSRAVIRLQSLPYHLTQRADGPGQGNCTLGLSSSRPGAGPWRTPHSGGQHRGSQDRCLEPRPRAPFVGPHGDRWRDGRHGSEALHLAGSASPPAPWSPRQNVSRLHLPEHSHPQRPRPAAGASCAQPVSPGSAGARLSGWKGSWARGRARGGSCPPTPGLRTPALPTSGSAAAAPRPLLLGAAARPRPATGPCPRGLPGWPVG